MCRHVKGCNHASVLVTLSPRNCLIATCTWLDLSADRVWSGPLQGACHLPAPAELSISRLPVRGVLQEAPDQPCAGQQKGNAAYGPLQSKHTITSLQVPELVQASCVIRKVNEIVLGASMPDNGAVLSMLVRMNIGCETICSGPFGSLLFMNSKNYTAVQP